MQRLYVFVVAGVLLATNAGAANKAPTDEKDVCVKQLQMATAAQFVEIKIVCNFKGGLGKILLASYGDACKGVLSRQEVTIVYNDAWEAEKKRAIAAGLPKFCAESKSEYSDLLHALH
jgi:hypothetical protein